MNDSNGNNATGTELHAAGPEAGQVPSPASEPGDSGTRPEIATRGGQQKKPNLEQKQIVLVAAAGLVVVLLLFVLVSVPHETRASKLKSAPNSQTDALSASATAPTRSAVPVTESSAAQGKNDRDGSLREQDVQRTAAPGQVNGNSMRAEGLPRPAPGTTLGAIPSFNDDSDWQPPADALNSPNPIETAQTQKSERDMLEKPSMVFVRNASTNGANNRGDNTIRTLGLGLPTGTRLRARLETVATSAVKLPAIAVIEYNYERDGQILIPAGAKALGHVEQADGTGFMSIRFDTLLMPDGTELAFEAVATDLGLAPLRGKVQGKNTGKNILARSVSGLGQAGALFAGRGSLNQPLSEQDLVRERVATNIGDESDREVTRLAVSEHLVVSVPAGTPIYVVLQQTTKQPLHSAATASQSGANSQNQELLQLLQKQLSAPTVAAGRAE